MRKKKKKKNGKKNSPILERKTNGKFFLNDEPDERDCEGYTHSTTKRQRQKFMPASAKGERERRRLEE